MKEEFKELEKENEEIRDSLDGYLPIDKAENRRCWELINQITGIEIELEECCGK